MRAWVSALLAIVAVASSFSVVPIKADVEKVDMHGIENFSKIEGMAGFAGPVAGFGGATQPSAMPGLKSAGFTTVINLRLASEEGVDIEASRTAAEVAGLRYAHLPFDSDSPDPAVVEEFLNTVGTNANQPVYMHCNSATRAAAMWMIGRVLEDGWELEAASREVEVITTKSDKAIAFATQYVALRRK